MVIRNPYGFIAKYYKIINLILLIPMIYIMLKFNDIANFFKDYVSAGYSTPETNFAESYITGLSIISIIFMLITYIIFYWIFTTKKKNNAIYGIAIIYYFILLLSLFFFYVSMTNIEMSQMDPTFANFVRDFASLIVFPIYVFMIFTVSKGIGFNFKTFRLDNNSELQLSEEDEEDIEIKIGSNNGSIKKNIVHTIRELKYYTLENKLVISWLIIIALGVIVVTSYTNYKNHRQTFTINQAISINNFTLSLKDSYITNTDYRGNLISEDKYYLAIKIGIHNQGEATKIDSSSFRIYIGNKYLYPSYDKSSRFIDIGKIYQGETINANEANNYVFVYELEKSQIKNSYQMKIINGLREKEGKLIKSYKNINVRPSNVLRNEQLGNIENTKTINLESTTLGSTKYRLKSLEIVSAYQYEYENCISNNNCTLIKDTIVPSGGKAIVVLEDELILDKNTSYYLNSEKDFYNDFVSIKYQYNPNAGINNSDKTVKTRLKNITPKVLKDKKIYEVPSSLLNADKIDLVIQVRNKIVNMKIK